MIFRSTFDNLHNIDSNNSSIMHILIVFLISQVTILSLALRSKRGAIADPDPSLIGGVNILPHEIVCNRWFQFRLRLTLWVPLRPSYPPKTLSRRYPQTHCLLQERFFSVRLTRHTFRQQTQVPRHTPLPLAVQDSASTRHVRLRPSSHLLV